MELQYLGANCVRLSTKKAVVVIDDNLVDLGAKPITKAGDIALYTMAHGEPAADVKLTLDQPGEYEVSDVSIKGIPARAHIDEPGQETATMYQIVMEDVRVGVLGHIYPDLSNDQLEALGMIDVLIIPVGGNGFTLDPAGALKLIKAIEPKIVIPAHYDEKGLNYPVPQQTLEDALKSLSMEPRETVAKLKVKAGELAETTQLIVLERS
jgi:L-ascorbate metabolism protein UlaG (beta-lactamase superfamily)